MHKKFSVTFITLLMLPLLADAQFSFVKLADEANTGSVPQMRPFLVDGDVYFNGFLPNAAFKLTPGNVPFEFLVPGTQIPGEDEGTVFSSLAVLDIDTHTIGVAGFNENNRSGHYLITPDGVVPLAGLSNELEQPSFLSVNSGNAAFVTGQFAVGAFTAVNAYRNGAIETIAERGTPLPEGAPGETFHMFSSVDIEGDFVLFPALGSAGTEGIYYQRDAGRPIRKLFDTGDAAPGGSSYMTLTADPLPILSGTNVAFFAEMKDGREALFLSRGLQTPVVLADKLPGEQKFLPGGMERVDRIERWSIDGDRIAFIASDENDTAEALFVTEGNEIVRVFGTGQQIEGQTIVTLGGGPGMIEGDTITFGGSLGFSADNIYRTDNLLAGFEPVGLVDNGSFEDGLDGWTTSGTVEATDTPAAELTSDTDPGVGTAEISQLINTLEQTYWLWFDALFTTTTGSLDVLIAGQVVATIPAPPTLLPAFQRHEVTIDDPALFGLDGVELTFRLNPGSLSTVQIASVFSPADGTLGVGGSGGDGFQINAGLNDAWFNPATNGQGFFFIVFENIPLVFLAWFTYDTERPDASIEANLGDPGHRWITAQGPFEGDTATLDVVLTTGGVFDAGDPAPENSIIGEMDVVFEDCTQGVVKYDIPSLGLMGEVPIQRIANDNVPLCESMAE